MTLRRKSGVTCPARAIAGPTQDIRGAERLVGLGFRCWLAGYDTGDISCWETGWNTYATALGPDDAKRAVTELACWVRSLRDCAARPLEYYPFGCAGFCSDERFAISLIAAAQHDRCPAIRACAYALTGSHEVDRVIDSASAFAGVLQDANQLLAPVSLSGHAERPAPASRRGVH